MRGPIVAIASLVLATAAGCGEDVDPAWQLDHDRIIAVRITPPRIAAGESAQVDALLGFVGAPPREAVPGTVTVVSPESLAGALAQRDGRWIVTTPGDGDLVAARAELELEAGAPVPLRLKVTFAENTKVGLKVVWLGEHADNPVLDPIAIGDTSGVTATSIAVPAETDVPLAVDFDDSHVVNWLTSCGTMHDFDLARAYLRVEPEDPHEGTLGVVVRDERGGVAWKLWPITAE